MGFFKNTPDMTIHEAILQASGTTEENYFLFLINPNNGSNTNGHVIYLVYKELLSRYPLIPIYYVVDKDGVSGKTIGRYFTEVLKLPFTDKERKNTFVSRELYRAAGGSAMSKLIYIYRSEVFYEKPFKYSHPDALFFPQTVIRIEKPEKIRMHADEYLNTNLNEFIPCNNTILQIADVHNRVAMIDPRSGYYLHFFDKSRIDPVQLYSTHITRSKPRIEFMKAGMKWFGENNREQLPVYNAARDNSYIYIFFGMQVLEKVREDKFIPDGTGGRKTLPKGETIASLYHFVAKCDEQLNILHIYHFRSPELKEAPFLDAAPDICMYCKEDKLYCFNSIDCEITPEISASPGYRGVSLYRFSGQSLEFDSITEVPFVERYEEKGDFLVNGTITEWNGHVFVIYNTSPFIYTSGFNRPVGKLNGHFRSAKEDRPDTYTKNLLDETPVYVGWEFLTSGLIHNDSLFAILYKHHGDVFLELKNNRMITVQMERLTGFPDLRQGNVIIMDNALYIWVFEQDDFFFYKYPLQEI